MAENGRPTTHSLAEPDVGGGFPISPIWLFPIVALVIGGWLVFQTLSQKGPTITIAFKAAAGALEHLPVAIVNSVADAVARLEELAVWTVGLDAGAEESVFECPLFSEAVAVVIGGEGGGLSRLVRDRVSKLVRIPMAPGVESLNASVSAALAMFEVTRVRSQHQ